MFTKVKTLKLAGLIALFVVTALIAPVSAAEFAMMQGRLVDEDCLKAKSTPCPLYKFTGENLVIVGLDDKVYKIGVECAGLETPEGIYPVGRDKGDERG